MPLERSSTDLSRRKRTQWQRSNSHPTGQHTALRPIPVSKSTKNKLDSFRAPKPDDTAAGDDPAAPRDAGKASPRSSRLDKENRHADETKATVKTNTASTPIGRLAWEDIMGNVDDKKDDEDSSSPSDRIGWDHARSSLSMTPVVSRKGKKRARARSSSPTVSPASSKRTPATPAVDSAKLASVLKTPHADPILELWDRCAVSGTENTSPSGLTNPLLAQCMISSSPRPTDGNRSHERPLRKSMSYGPSFKRRKMDKFGPTALAALQRSPQPNSKLSMVSALLKTVDGEIQKSTLEAENRSSPSPSPERRPAKLDRLATQDEAYLRDSGRAQPVQLLLPVAGATVTTKNMDKSSDYGDDFDFDEETLMELDTGLQILKEDDRIQTPPPEPTRQEQPQSAVTPAPPQMMGPSKLDDDDEFDDLDDEIFDGAEDLMVEVESAFPSQAGVQPPIQSTLHQASGAVMHQHAEQQGEDDYGDAFEDDFDFEAAELVATQSATAQKSTALPHPSQKPKTIQRYKINRVMDAPYVNDQGRESLEKILVVQSDGTNSIKTIHLRDDWMDTPATVGSYVHVVGEFESSGSCFVTNNQNMLILHPDQLISSTVVGDSFNCTRQAVLEDRVKATSDLNPPLVYGTILHEIFQEALMANKWDTAFLGSLIAKILNNHLEKLYTIKVSIPEARDHLLSKMGELRSWARVFVSPYPRPDANVRGRKGEKAQMCVSKLLDVEEHVWSPMYGLKGNIDATVQVTMREGGNGETKTLTVPFEVKTGKHQQVHHQAQTALYNLLISDRYDIEVTCGILYYMETSETLRIPAVRHELRHMIMQRNQLACHVRERSVQLPPMKRNNTCNRCFAQTTCFIYHKLADDGDGETSGMGKKFDEVVQHLTPTHKEFFLKWEDLLTKEEKESQKLRRELWTMLSTEREKVGRCFANVIIEEGSAHEDLHKPKINRFTYTFVKEQHVAGFSFLESQLTVGEPVVVSDEQGHFALANGYVTAVKKHRISVAVDRRLHNARIRQPGFDAVDNQIFASIMEVGPNGAKLEQTQSNVKEAPIRYRLDRDGFSNGMATVRNNLVQVMADGPQGSRRIRELVVDRATPRFKTTSTQYVISGKGSLNVDQERAIEKVMSAMDYALVLGMPGTGKTTTIAHIIRALVAQGKSVLLTSYTHTAVDNILLKLQTDSIPILRLGTPAKVHPEVRNFVTLAAEPKESFEEIKAAWHDTPIVATTCLGINHLLFNERTFDYCIVDEASQITLPICLGPIRMARTFVLVGDHNQLPPLVQNEDARLGGLDVSLFKLLSDTHPESVVNLEHQYRMCEDIMTLSNTLIYNGRLKCGTEGLRNASLNIPSMRRLQDHHMDRAAFMASNHPTAICTSPTRGQCWLADLLDPEARVRFVSTDAIPGSREEAKGNRIVNACEASIVAQLVDALLSVGVPASEIGVMTHYRSQLSLLRHSLLGLARGTAPASVSGAQINNSSIEMHTADRFQGRDKDVVVLSLVRSNDACSIGDLLKDWRRINVAFTRAKTKLLVVGSRSTLKGSGEDEMLSKFIGLMEQRDWVYELPPDALHVHRFDEVGATASAAAPAATIMRSPGSSTAESKVLGVKSKVSATNVSPRRKRMPTRQGKENNAKRHEPKRLGISQHALMRGKPILRDILNDLNGGY